MCCITDDDIVNFKIVDSVTRINLMETDAVRKFARILIATLKYVHDNKLLN